MTDIRQSRSTGSDLQETAQSVAQTVRDSAATMNDQLKSVGVDTGAIADAARDKAGEFQAMAAAEIRKRPFHAIAAAALVGFYFGVRR